MCCVVNNVAATTLLAVHLLSIKLRTLEKYLEFGRVRGINGC